MTHVADPQPTESKINEALQAINEFLADEAELAAAELKPAAKHAAIGAGMFTGAGTLALHALWMLIIAFALAIGWALDSWTVLGPWGSFTFGFVLTAIISLLIGFVLVKLGQGQMKKVKKPEATIAEAKATLQAIAHALGRIKDDLPATTVVQADDDAWRRPRVVGTDFRAG